MKNKILYRLLIMVITITTVLGAQTMVFAKKVLPTSVPTPSAGGKTDNFLDLMFGSSEIEPSISDPEIITMASEILGVISFAGYAIAIGMTLYAGIRYMMAAANEKADLKSASIRLVIGALIVASASAVFPIVWEIFAGMAD